MDPQLKAIETIDCNLAVNAGAGTGKTKVLTERFVYILGNGDLEEFKEVESIVAITFTNKATQEMIERIRGEIKKNFHKNDKWKRFYRDLERANISTIHGFCSKILRENPIEANIDPYFEILDENTSKSLLNQSILQVLGEQLEKDGNVFKMMKAFRQYKIENIVEDILALYNNVRTVGMSFEELKKKTVDYITSLEVKKEDIEEIKETLLYLMENLSKRSKIYKLKSDPVWMEFYNGDYKKEDIYIYIEYIQENLGSSNKEVEKQNRLRELLSKVLLGKEKKNLWLYETLLDLLIKIDKVYENFKRVEGGLDYDDLQNKVLTLLDNESIKKKYHKKFRYFMIDEFQDTNELQKKIFYKLASNNKPLDRENLFVVGDPKQSIYGFRGADIDVFYDVIQDIASFNQDNIITLQRNYRSTNTLLKFVNTIFSTLMGGRYDKLVAHNKSENPIDVEIIDREDMEKIEGIDDSTLANIQEADIIARRIRELVDDKKYNYGDFALLFRSTTRNHFYEKALRDYNIPYFNSSSKRYFHKQEIIDLINGLKAISNPYDHIATIGFLRGPMIGLRDDTIYWILRNKEENIYETMIKMKSADTIYQDEKYKLTMAIELLDYFFNIKDLYDISHIVEELIEKTLFIETLLLKSHGDQSMANVYKFLEITREYDSSSRPSLEDYIDYLEELRKKSEEEGVIHSEDANVVKLMTIHGSKGLQFPVVIIPEMARDAGGAYPSILFNKDIGIGIRTQDNRALYDMLRTGYITKDMEERKRVLYVAMTRAKELLILGNQGKDKGFKGLIKDLLPKDQYRTIPELDIIKKPIIPAKSIDEDLISHSGETIDIPLLYEIEEYDKKHFTRYNISQYLIFNECERKFFLDHYWKIDIGLNPPGEDSADFQLNPIDKGNIVHDFCYLYRSGMDKDILLEEITKSYGLAYEDVNNEIEPYIQNYLIHYSEDYDIVYREKPFHIKMGNGYLNGVIDRINIKDDKIEILDYKTNRLWNKAKLIKEYTPQVQIYAYALEQILGKKVSKANILFLETGEEASIDISTKSLENTKNKIEDFIDYINNHKDLEDYKKTLNCNEYCSHKLFCQWIVY